MSKKNIHTLINIDVVLKIIFQTNTLKLGHVVFNMIYNHKNASIFEK